MTGRAVKKLTVNALFERYIESKKLADSTRDNYIAAWNNRKIETSQFFHKFISTHLLPCGGWSCPVASELVEPYFTRFLRVLSFCLGVSNGVFFCGNGVVNGVVGWAIMGMELHENKG